MWDWKDCLGHLNYFSSRYDKCLLILLFRSKNKNNDYDINDNDNNVHSYHITFCRHIPDTKFNPQTGYQKIRTRSVKWISDIADTIRKLNIRHCGYIPQTEYQRMRGQSVNSISENGEQSSNWISEKAGAIYGLNIRICKNIANRQLADCSDVVLATFLSFTKDCFRDYTFVVNPRCYHELAVFDWNDIRFTLLFQMIWGFDREFVSPIYRMLLHRVKRVSNVQFGVCSRVAHECKPNVCETWSALFVMY